MSAVDVLEVMDRSRDVLAEIYAKHQRKIGPFATQAQKANGSLREARAAVAELIAADEEYDAAKRALFQPSEYSREKADRLCAANTRRDAALARCKGETA